jgi:hypothetical protein
MRKQYARNPYASLTSGTTARAQREAALAGHREAYKEKLRARLFAMRSGL